MGGSDGQRRFARTPRAGQAGDQGPGPRRSGAHDQRGPPALRFRVPARAFHREQAVGLRARAQDLDEALLRLAEAAVAAVQRLRDQRGVESLLLARPPRQRQDHPGAVQNIFESLRLRTKRPPECTAHLPADRVGQLAGRQVGEGLFDARVRCHQRAHRVERRRAGPAVARGRRGPDRRLAGGHRPDGPLAKQAERLLLVDYPSAGRRQVG